MSRQFIHFFASIALASIVASSCVPTSSIPDPYTVATERQHENIYYVPGAAYSPLSSKKNDLDLSVLHSSGNRFTGLDVHGGYVASKHFGIMGGLTAVRHPSGSPHFMNFHKFEGGAGYIAPFKNRWHFETYGGVGGGRIANQHHTGYSNVKLTNYFLQPAVAYNSPAGTFTFGMLSRFSAVHFSASDIAFDADREQNSIKNFNIIRDKPTHLMWEPGLVMRAGWKNFKFDAGYRYSADLTNSDLYRSGGNFSIGASLQLNTTKQ